MKNLRIIPCMFFISLLLACGDHKTTGNASDTSAKVNDTSVISGNQKNIKSDSVSGDPSSKGTSDPNARLPKK